jgi:glycosyltransferase involved in cell wall biosynthesis
MNADLKVTLVMPTRNRSHVIRRAIGTILAQTYPNWELIVSNNGSDPYQFDDPRIRVIDSSAEVGAAYARNQAIPHATGDLVGFFDDDDEMYPEYLESFVAVFHENPAVQMVKCYMIHRGILNVTYGTPTVLLRRRYVTPTWEPRWRQDHQYYLTIIDANGFSEENGSLHVLALPLCRANNDPRGGLRDGSL